MARKLASENPESEMSWYVWALDPEDCFFRHEPDEDMLSGDWVNYIVLCPPFRTGCFRLGFNGRKWAWEKSVTARCRRAVGEEVWQEIESAIVNYHIKHFS